MGQDPQINEKDILGARDFHRSAAKKAGEGLGGPKTEGIPGGSRGIWGALADAFSKETKIIYFLIKLLNQARDTSTPILKISPVAFLAAEV